MATIQEIMSQRNYFADIPFILAGHDAPVKSVILSQLSRTKQTQAEQSHSPGGDNVHRIHRKPKNGCHGNSHHNLNLSYVFMA